MSGRRRNEAVGAFGIALVDPESLLGSRFLPPLLEAASERIKYRYPDFWATHQKTLTSPEIAELVANGPPLGSEIFFADYRALLTAALDLDVGIRYLRAALRLYGAEPDPGSLAGLGMNEGEWAYYHYQLWMYALAGVFERAKRLIRGAVRSLRRPYDPAEWKATEAALIAPVEKLRELTKALRDPFAHGGALEPIAQAGVWEGMSAARTWPDLPLLLEPMALSRQAHHEAAKKASQQALALIIHALDKLDTELDWARVREASTKNL